MTDHARIQALADYCEQAGWISTPHGLLPEMLRALAAMREERDKWLDAFNRSEQFQSGPTKRAEQAEAAASLYESLADNWKATAQELEAVNEHLAEEREGLRAELAEMTRKRDMMSGYYEQAVEKLTALTAAHERVRGLIHDYASDLRGYRDDITPVFVRDMLRQLESALTSPEGPQNKDHEDHEDNSARVDTKAPSLDSRTASPTGPMRWVCKKCKKPRRRSECLSCGNQEPLSDEPCVSGVIV